jgi:hypothetical protein
MIAINLPDLQSILKKQDQVLSFPIPLPGFASRLSGLSISADTVGHKINNHVWAGDEGRKILIIFGHDHSEKHRFPQSLRKLLNGQRRNGNRVFGEN